MPESHRIIAANDDRLREHSTPEAGVVRTARVFAHDGISMMLITLGEGAVMREHTATAPILLRGLTGRTSIAVAGEEVQLDVGTLLHIETGVPHALSADGGASQVVLTVFRGA
ncbi:cupin domain-containing protein [Agromyces marinus]|uniref:Cupin domain-containing protein n=1 Tax=Agromyces marinus TaxID=1389020 RepID=A0ABN6YF41_9MICO|nr:hypothetical protein [Agromyces marinus]UIP58964.1 hypothetical protein DSM26151_18550 [Agromyces marinus]BDZ56067.1 hypothetical protein GCM10025870_31400 [Agromyces marinus]